MTNRNYKWLLHHVKSEANDTITIFFDTQGQAFNFKAGQFINVSLYIDGEKITRSYSLSSSPTDLYPSVTVKRVPKGIMSNYLLVHAESTREWEIEGPYGNFIISEDDKQRELIFLGGGSGITPLYSMMKYLIPKRTRLTLVNANRTLNDIIFRNDIEEWEALGKLTVFHALTGEGVPDNFSRNIIRGRLNRLIVKLILKQICLNPLEAHYFICGPEQLMAAYKEALIATGVPEEQIFSESFLPTEDKNNILQLPEEPHEVVMHYYESVESEEETSEVMQVTSLINVKAGQSILSAALDNGLPVKHSCKNGTCGSCWARYIEGNLKMIKNYALTDEEVSQNYILLCQSYPLNDEVVVEFEHSK